MSAPAAASSEPRPRARWGERIGIAAMTAARFLLAFGMLPYGISKLIDLQFQVGASHYTKPLGEIPGTILTWAFLGYSPVFQFLMGALETGPAVLLFFSRTWRLGALLLFPVLLNVVAINYFLDLWPQTQRISSVFLALNVFLLAYDHRMYRDFLSRLLAKPEPIANKKWRIASKIAGLAVATGMIVFVAMDLREAVASAVDPISDFIGERQINRAGSWEIESLRIAGTPIESAAGRSLYFDFSGGCLYESVSGNVTGKYEAHKAAHTFRILNIPMLGGFAVDGTYRVNGDRLLLDGSNGTLPVSLVLRRDNWGHHPHS